LPVRSGGRRPPARPGQRRSRELPPLRNEQFEDAWSQFIDQELTVLRPGRLERSSISFRTTTAHRIIGRAPHGLTDNPLVIRIDGGFRQIALSPIWRRPRWR
jgi:hypothetical protein